MELDSKTVHSGSGIVKYDGVPIGRLDVVDFVFEPVGIGGPDRMDRETCYGTVSGALEDTSVIAEFNTKEPETVSVEISVEAKGEVVKVLLERVEFIDDIPSSGVFTDVEFHGTLVK
ncbi:MAG: hypothetical protein ABH834_03975 [Candidatus Altiarchaeota archaeon]